VEDSEPVPGAYRGACIAGIVPALLGGRPDDRLPAWFPGPVQGARTVVLLVLDGLGWEALTEHPQALAVVSGLDGGPITTVVPSTTASALTSITTGLSPAQHGVVGFRILVDGRVMNVLSWQGANGRRAPDPFTVQRHPPFLGRPVPVVTKSEFRTTGFTGAHLRDARFVGYTTPSSMVEHVRLLAAAGEPFVYAYYAGIDSVAHAHGLHDGFYPAELAAADRLVGDLLAALPAEAALLVTSDHGQVHVGPEGWVGLDPLDHLVTAYSGDGRFRYLHAAKGAAAELLEAARDAHGGHAWVWSRQELLDGGWLGPDVSPAARRRVGDVVLAAREPVAFVDPALPREAHLVSAHGSLTASEMMVPLLAGRGSLGPAP
jgi:Type I phosphodiesterase / nucleotide pyrophosphatase